MDGASINAYMKETHRPTPLITDPIRMGPPWLALVTALVKVKVARHG
jgi:hypothetical protein